MYKKIHLLIASLALLLTNASAYADNRFNYNIHFSNVNNVYHIENAIKFKIKVRSANNDAIDIRNSNIIKPGQVTEINEENIGITKGYLAVYVADAENPSIYKRCISGYPYDKGIAIIVQGWGKNNTIDCNITDD